MIARTATLLTATAANGLLFAQSFLPPAPFGGEQAVKWLIDQEFTVPAEMVSNNIDGEIELTFTVQADGTAKDLRVTASQGEVLDKEALRMVRLIRWHPASVGGSALDTERTLSIPVNTKKYKKLHDKDGPRAPFLDIPADASGQLLQDRGLDSLAKPMIPGGLRGVPKYFGENLRYPDDARRRDIQGKVGVEFVVECSGSISNLRAVEALGGGCDDEAMRLIRSMEWRPAFKNGERVRSIMRMDIQFRLNANLRP